MYVYVADQNGKGKCHQTADRRIQHKIPREQTKLMPHSYVNTENNYSNGHVRHASSCHRWRHAFSV